MAEPITVRSSEDGSVALVSVPLAGSGTDEASARALEALRRDVIPATIGSVGGAEIAVTGRTALSEDFKRADGASGCRWRWASCSCSPSGSCSSRSARS